MNMLGRLISDDHDPYIIIIIYPREWGDRKSSCLTQKVGLDVLTLTQSHRYRVNAALFVKDITFKGS